MHRALLLTVVVLLMETEPLFASSEEGTQEQSTSDFSARMGSLAAEASKRPAALPTLYVTFAALQVADAKATSFALSRGAHELNPVMANRNDATVWALKAASTATTVYFVERIWRKNRKVALLMMTAINLSYGAIAVHNVRVARRYRGA